ncbi:MAG: hypothetical protein EAY75_12390 [Bacteroidetes bacterium]|nr:MAG: hypothetical protein EAY75_12390 [Bacteroidota bacterium]
MMFYALAIYKWANGLWMYQMEPIFFNTRFDGTTWLLMQTGVHTWLLHHPAAYGWCDALFYGWPLVYAALWQKKPGSRWAVCVVWLLINWLYVQCYTLYPTNSIEAHLGWLLLPLLLGAQRLQTFYFVLHGLRYVFIFLFFTAGVWKLRQGGFFNVDQMSGILLYQHSSWLVSEPNHWYSQAIYWLVQHPVVGYLLYAGLTIWELVWAVGFFTKRYDCLLFVSFLVFLVTDYALMRIPYTELLPLALLLLFSGYLLPKAEEEQAIAQ